MYYGRIIYNTLEVAPQTYTKSDGTVIFNFNKNEELMKSYGFKPVRETVPPYDKQFERLYQQSLTEDDEYIYLVFGVEKLPNVGTVTVDMSNYYTKAETYNRTEIQQLLNNLDIDFAEIKELQAAYAKIEELDTRIANIEKANIGELDAMYAEIKELKADIAKIGNLDVLYAHIDTLDVDVATIKTLINGHLTSDNIHSMVITSDKFTVENGFIKNAMIDHIDAGKINAGIINTNNVVLQSEDGDMLIQGALQQFKDNNGNVRIQIGKDAVGDFTFLLYDAEGKGVLIDESGIRSSDALGDGLIVDANISEDASISGGKIDIDSLVTEVNESESVIKATHIQLDDLNQTLDIAFNTMTNSLETTKTQVSTNTTNINAVQGSISTLISNSTIVNEDGSTTYLKDAYSSTAQTVDGLVTKVGKLESGFSTSLKDSETQFYSSSSSSELIGGSWSTESHAWMTGKYIWQRIKYIYTDGTVTYSTPVCLGGSEEDETSNVYDVTLSRDLFIIPCDSEGNPIS